MKILINAVLLLILFQHTSTAQTAPVISPLPDQVIAEGGSFTTLPLDPYVSDAEDADADITWAVAGGVNITASINASRQAVFTITDAEWNGSETFIFTATDPGLLEDNDTIVMTVTAVNDAPAISGQNPLDTDEDTPLTITLNDIIATDVDNQYPDDFTLELTEGIEYDISGATVTPVADFFGQITVPARIYDGNLYSNSFELDITVNPVNDAPVITGDNNPAMTEDTPYNLKLSDLVISDVDNVSGDFSLEVEDGINYTYTGTTITPVLNFNGVLNVIVKVNDNETANYLSATYVLNINVSAVNDKPVISSQKAVSIPEDTDYTIVLADFTASDVDAGDNFPTGFTLTTYAGASYTLSGNKVIPTPDYFGLLEVPVRIDDGNGANSLSDEFIFEIIVTPVNDAPVLTGTFPTTINEDASILITTNHVQVTDVDNIFPDDFTIITQNGDNYARVGNTISPAPNFSGTLTVPVQVSDGSASNNLSNTKNLTITVNPVNDAPVIQSTSPLATDEDTPFTINLTDLQVNDVDNIYPTGYNLIILNGVNYSHTGNVITPEANFNGNIDVLVRVNDGMANNNLSEIYTITVPVNAVDDKPVLTTIPAPTIAEGGTFANITLPDYLLEVDGDDVIYTVSGQADLLPLISGANILAVGIPDPDWFGAETLTITATDNTVGALSDSYDVLFTVTPVDDAPVVASPIPDYIKNEDFTAFDINLENTFDDIDNDNAFIQKFISSNTNPDLLNASISGNSMQISPIANKHGITTLTITAVSNSVSVEETFSLTVNAVDDAPVLANIPDQIIAEGGTFNSFNLNNFLTEVDGDNVNFGATGQNALNVSIAPNGSVTVVPTDLNWNGTETITFSATDQSLAALAGTYDVSFTVTPVDDAPFVQNPLPDLVRVEDAASEIIDLSAVFTDIDNDPALINKTIVSVSDASAIDAGVDGNELTITYLPNAFGTVTVTIRGNSAGKTVDDVFSISISPVDDPPSITNIDNQSIDEGALFDAIPLNDFLSEVDGDAVTWSYSGNTDLNVNINAQQIASVAAPDPDWFGSEIITFTVTDNTPNAKSASKAVQFTIDPIDDAPYVLNPIADIVLSEDDPDYTVNISNVFDDIDNLNSGINVSIHSIADTTLLSASISGNDLIISPRTNQNGSTSIIFRGNSAGKFADETILVTLLPVDDAPVVNFIPGQTVDEDEPFATFDLDAYLENVDNDNIIWTYSGNNLLAVSIDANNVVTISAPLNYNGSETITFTATDDTPAGLSDFASAEFKVDPDDDAPIVNNPISDITVPEDSPNTIIDVTNVFTDVDNVDSGILKFVSNSNPEIIGTNLSGNILTINYLANQNGVVRVNVIGISGGKNVVDTFFISVTPVDDEPIVSSISGQSVNEGETLTPFNINDHLTEVDGDAIEWIINGNDDLDVSIAPDGVVTFTQPNPDWFGTKLIRFTAQDQTANGFSDFAEAEFAILPIDDAPVVANAIQDYVIDENDPAIIIPLNNVFNDIDNNNNLISKSVTLNTNPAVVSTNITANQLILTPVPYAHGMASITLRGTSNGKFIDDNFTIQINAVDDAPVIQLISSQIINEGESFSTFDLDEFLTEYDGDLVTWSIVNNSDLIVNRNGNNVVSVSTPDINWFGEEQISFVATDNTVNALSDEIAVTFTVNPVDDAPFLDVPLADISVQEDADNTTLDLSLTFNDIDNLQSSISKSLVSNSNPDLVSASVSGNILTLDVKENQNGSTEITIRGTSSGKNAEESFILTVNAVDDIPLISNIPNQQINEGESFSIIDLDTYLDEVDGDAIMWNYSGNTNLSVNINNQNQAAVNIPNENWFGTNIIRFTATDNTGNALSSYQDVTYTVLPVDDAPFVANPIADVSMQEDQSTLSIDISTVFSDIDNNNLAISSVVQSNTNPGIVKASISNNVVALTPEINKSGTANITIRAFSNGKSVDELFTVNISKVNDPPVFTLTGDVSVIEDFTETIAVEATTASVPVDETTQEVTYMLTPDNVSFASIGFDANIGKVTITSLPGKTGTQLFTLKADDGQSENNLHEESFTLTVNPKLNQSITFGTIEDRIYGDPPVVLNATSSSGLPVSYQIINGDATLSGNVLYLNNAGVITIRASQPGNALYYSATPVDVTFEVLKSPQFISFENIATKTFGDEPFPIVASASSGLPVSFTLISGPAALNGETLSITGAGSVSVRATQNGNQNFQSAGDVIKTFSVSKAQQTITFPVIPNKRINDPAFVITASSSSGLPVTLQKISGPIILDNGVVTIIGQGEASIRATQAGNANYAAAASVTRSFFINDKLDQFLTFNSLPDRTWGDTPFTLNATSSSGYPVAFSIISGPATLDGNLLTLTGTGMVTVRAEQNGDATYNPASPVEQSFTVSKADQVITYTPVPSQNLGDDPVVIDAASSSGLPVSLTLVSGPGTLDGNTLTLNGAGEIIIEASQVGNALFNPAETVTISVLVGKETQTIVFPDVTPLVYNGGGKKLNATATSGLPVVYTLVSGPGVIENDTIYSLGAGIVVVSATQDGNNEYLAAEPVQKSIVIEKAGQTINYLGVADKTWGDAPFNIQANASSGLPVEVNHISGPVALSEQNLVTLTGTGTAIFQLAQPGNDNYKAAEIIEITFEIEKAPQEITFTKAPLMYVEGNGITLEAIASSGLPVSFELISGPGELNADILSPTDTGNILIEAIQPGNELFMAANPVRQWIRVENAYFDGALTGIISPDTEIPLGSGVPVPITLKIRNNGNIALGNFRAVYNINDGMIISKQLIEHSIQPGEDFQFTFTDRWVPQDDDYKLCAYLEGIDNDGDTSNDSLCLSGFTVDIEESLANRQYLFVFPNPAREVINFEMTLPNKKTVLHITDASGKRVLEKSFYPAKEDFSIAVDLARFEYGLYFYTLFNGEMRYAGKFVKQ